MIQIPLVKSHEAFVRKTPETTKAHFGHFLQIFKKGSPQKILKKFSAKMPDLREKCAYIKIYDIIDDHTIIIFSSLQKG